MCGGQKTNSSPPASPASGDGLVSQSKTPGMNYTATVAYAHKEQNSLSSESHYDAILAFCSLSGGLTFLLDDTWVALVRTRGCCSSRTSSRASP